MRKDRAKSWLIKSTMVAPLACTSALLHAQDADTTASVKFPKVLIALGRHSENASLGGSGVSVRG